MVGLNDYLVPTPHTPSPLAPLLYHSLTLPLPHLLTPSLLTPSPPHTLIFSPLPSPRIPLHNEVWKTLLNQITLLNQVDGPNPAVFQAVTLAIYFLVVNDGRLVALSSVVMVSYGILGWEAGDVYGIVNQYV